MKRILGLLGLAFALGFGPAQADPAVSPGMDHCVGLAEARVILETQGGAIEHFNAQGVAVLALAYRNIYGERMRAADEALVLHLKPQGRIPLVHVVLFKEACAVGEGSIPREIYLTMVNGRVT